MLCPVCFAHCENDNGWSFGMYFHDVDKTFAILPCSAREQFPQHFSRGFLNYRAHGRRYVVDVYRGHNTTRIRGNDLWKFIKDFNLGHGQLVLFVMTGRIAKAYVCSLGGGFSVGVEAEAVDDMLEDEEEQGGAAQGVAGYFDEEEGEQGDAAQVDEEENNGQNVEEAPPGIIYSRDANLVEAEGRRLGMLIAIDEGKIGSRFVNRLTSTNVTNKLMKIPNKVWEMLNIAEVGFVGIRLGDGHRIRFRTRRMEMGAWF